MFRRNPTKPTADEIQELFESSPPDAGFLNASPSSPPSPARQVQFSSEPVKSGENGILRSQSTSNIDTDARLNRELKRMLSIHSVVSTASTAARAHDEAQSRGAQTYKKIGAGACGAIFAQDGKSVVVKVAKGNELELWNDYLMHAKIADAFREFDIASIRVPKYYYYSPRMNESFFDQNPGLKAAAAPFCNFPTAALLTERILPLPKNTRGCLIDKFCDPNPAMRASARADPANHDCLVRVYLGLPRGWGTGRFFSLRNFKLHLNQMVELDLNVHDFAHRMGDAMAIMHWAAETDARDVEFALGSASKAVPLSATSREIERMAPCTYTGPESRVTEDFFHRATELWVLDFNQVKHITMDEEGVAAAVNAAMINDPYIPKPNAETEVGQKIWEAFCAAYLRTAEKILQKKDPESALAYMMGLDTYLFDLPQKFLDGLIEAHKAKSSSQGSQTSMDCNVSGSQGSRASTTSPT